MIGIIDYGCGNVGSVVNMFSKIGIWSEPISNPEKADAYSALVLPGVGTFDKGVQKLKSSGFWDILNQKVQNEKVPILGICLGMQLFFEGSDEGENEGFGWLKGRIRKFDTSLPIRIPQMGWNTVDFKKDYLDFKEDEFYFVHGYHVDPAISEELILGTSKYGIEFPSAVVQDNITGFQFHPEKSLRSGMKLLEKWSESVVIK